MSVSQSTNANASTSASTSTSESTTASLSDSTSASESMSNAIQHTPARHTTALPETGEDESSHKGLIGATMALLAGLGLMRRSKKDKNKNNDKA